MSASHPPATIADLDALGEGAQAELIDGVIYERPVTTFDHAHIAALIVADLLPAYQRGRGCPGGWWIQGENDFVVAAAEVFRPDALGWRKARLPEPPRAGRASIVPDWACEVISESNRPHDEVVKRAAYARVGIAHWWLVDPAARALTAHVLEGAVWRIVGRFVGAEVARVAPFEEVGLDMAEWWR
jgi:Uma2 family endonuclease